MLPAYEILDSLTLGNGNVNISVLVPSMEPNTPDDVRQEIFEAILEAEGGDEGSLYCSENAYKADLSADFLEANPGADQCTLGVAMDGVFHPVHNK
jgi:hypothetical protein